MGKDTEFNYGWFDSEPPKEVVDVPDPAASPGAAFDALPSSDNCDASLICDRCGKFHGRCSEVTAIKEQNNMALPTGGTPNQGATRNRGGVPKLEVTDLSRTPKEAKILGVKAVEGRFGPQVLCKLSLGGETRLWYLTADVKKNPNYKILIDKFGTEENDWMGQTFLLGLVVDDVTEQQFIRVTFPTGRAGRG